MYEYKALCTRVKDGDTVVCDVDLGFNTWLLSVVFRLSGINAPETNEPGGKEAKDFLRDQIEGRKVFIRTEVGPKGTDESDSFGRFIAVIKRTKFSRPINDKLVASGHAVYKSY